MKLFERIESVLDKDLELMTIQDQWSLSLLYNEVGENKANFSDKLNRKKQELDDIEAGRTLQLKEEKITTTDGKGNEKVANKYTESQISSIIRQETTDIRSEINELKFIVDKLDNKQKSMMVIITTLRDYLKSININYYDETKSETQKGSGEGSFYWGF